MKVLKIISYIVLLIVISMIIIFINNKVQSGKEESKFIATGELVNVNGSNMYVYTEGEGEQTLVFMSGGGTCSPVLDFKSLYSLLSDKYRIVVVEKFGYGFSDVVDIDRDIDSILSDTREALKVIGIEGPYILFPHSMSGLEALYWAQEYPEEVSAIVGLDMAFPDAYDELNINMATVNVGSFIAKLGILRLIPSASESDAIKYGTLTDEEKELYKIIFNRRTATVSMINEVKEVKDNAKKVAEGGIPDVPILLFCSNGNGTGVEEDIWRDIQKSNALSFSNSTIRYLDCSHYVHDIEYEKIAEESIEFINKIM